jgi:hypothetical protein
VKHLILGLLAATLSLSVSATNNLNLSKSNVDDTERASKINTSKSNRRDGVKDHGGNATKEQIAQCNAKKSTSEKRVCQQQFGIAVSDPGTPSDPIPGGCKTCVPIVKAKVKSSEPPPLDGSASQKTLKIHDLRSAE